MEEESKVAKEAMKQQREKWKWQKDFPKKKRRKVARMEEETLKFNGSELDFSIQRKQRKKNRPLFSSVARTEALFSFFSSLSLSFLFFLISFRI